MIRYNKMTWRLGNARKAFTCCRCSVEGDRGDWQYRPLTTSTAKRDRRLCQQCGEEFSLPAADAVFGEKRSKKHLSE